MNDVAYPPKRVSWSIRQSLYLLVAINLSVYFGTYIWREKIFALAELLPPAEPRLNQLLLVALLQAFLYLATVFVFVLLIKKEKPEALGLVRSDFGKLLFRGLLQGFLLFTFAIVFSVLISLLFPAEIEPQEISKFILLAKTPWEKAIPLIIAGVLAPLSEEVFFRGFLYPAFRNRWGVWRGMIFTSLIFGLLHFDLFRVLPLVLGGIWLNRMYEKSGTLYLPILAHAVWNLTMTVLLLSSGEVML